MIIGIDAGCLGIKDKRLKVGVYAVAKNLILQLKEIDTENTYLLYSFYPIDEDLLHIMGKNIKNVVVRPTLGWLSIWLPVRLMQDNVDVFLGLNQALPPDHIFKRYKSIVIFYDLAFELFPYMYPDSYKKMHRKSLYAAHKTDRIITISKKTKTDIIDIYHINENKIIPVHLGIEQEFFKKITKEKETKRKYFLFVGAIKRVKNIPNIIKGFTYYKQHTRKNYELVFVGGDKWFDPDIWHVMHDLPENIFKSIRFLGYVDDKRLIDLYSHAEVFVSPSYYEGFGLGFIEAMACGIPVIGSNQGSMPEIVSNAGILVNPDDPVAIGNALIRLTEDRNFRERCIENGRKRAVTFTWHAFARSVVKQIQRYE